MHYKAVVFDVDGTILDTRINIGVMSRSYHRLYPNRQRLPIYHFTRCYSMTGAMTSAYLNISPEMQPRMFALMDEEAAAVKDQIVVFEGIYELLCRLRDDGYLLGINTSRDAHYMGCAEQQHPSPVWDLFGLKVTHDLVENSKPAPDSLLYYMDKTGVSPGELLFVGDSLNDCLCAQRAGCDFALATWGTHPGDTIHATYYPESPQQLAELLKLSKKLFSTT